MAPLAGKLHNLPRRGRCRPNRAADEVRYAEPVRRNFGRIRIPPEGSPCLLGLPKVPAGGCGGDPLRYCRGSISAENCKFCIFAYFLTDSGTCYRCPLHIPPLRRGPSPAGEGRGLWLSGYTNSPGVFIPPVCTAPHPPPCSGGTFPGGEGYKASHPGKVMRGVARIVYKKLYIFWSTYDIMP